MLRMFPAHQRFEAAHRARKHVDLRLVVQTQLAGTDSASQVTEQRKLAAMLVVVSRIVNGQCGCLLLRIEQCRVGTPQQFRRLIAVDRIHANADAWLRY